MTGLFAPAVLLPFIGVIFHLIVPQGFLFSSRQKSKDFFSSISWEGGGQNHRTLIFFSASSTISNSLSGEQIKIKLNVLLIGVQSYSVMRWLWKKGVTCQALKCYCISHGAELYLDYRYFDSGAIVIRITITIINSYHSIMDWYHCRGLLTLSAKDGPVFQRLQCMQYEKCLQNRQLS